MPNEPKTIWLVQDNDGWWVYGCFEVLEQAEDCRKDYDRKYPDEGPHKVYQFREVIDE